MPTALVINPNTTPAMTDEIARTAARVFAPPWRFRAVQPPGGPESLESWFEAALASTAMLPLLKEHADADGVVLACFGDPGLYALREIVDGPVVGVAEAGFLTACMLGLRFGVLVGPIKDAAFTESLLWTYGLEKRCAGVQTMDIPVLDLHADRAATLAALTAGGGALAARGAEVLVLGCAGLSDYREEFEAAIGLPVIDPVEAACWQLRSLVEMRLATSRAGMFAKPAPKALTDLHTVLTPPLADWLAAQAERGFQK
ncbi:MAG: aspartate/glutamate racemase family protein [Chloroflexi bacterium]|nr:aspartate/glutamate racemase family protein [Chloroflexota bacterium]